MLSFEEKAYCRALGALRNKDYISADKEFEASGNNFSGSQGLKIIKEATKLMAVLRIEKLKLEKTEIAIEENLSHGEKAVICGQNKQEKTG
ncbi:MAG: hypothetical protein V3V99_09175 [candidate division Zixibacteria bacterium]